MDDGGILRSPKWLRAHSWEDRIEAARIPKLFKDFTTKRPPNVPRLVEWYEHYERGGLLILQGRDTSSGARMAAHVLGQLARQGESVRWVPAEGYIELYKEEWNDDDEGRLWRELKYITRAYDVLVIDGLGEEPNTEFERKILASLIKGRHERGLTTIITTPLTAMDMAQYSGRVGQYAAEGTTILVGGRQV